MSIFASGTAQAACTFAAPVGDDSYSCDSGVGVDLIDLAGNNSLLLSGDGKIDGVVNFDAGADSIVITGGTVTGAVSQGGNIDDFVMSGGTIGSLQQGDGYDTFNMSGGTIVGAFEDGDYAVMSGGTIGRVDMKLANNFFYLSNGTIGGNLVTGFGLDTIDISGGVIGGNVSVSGGNDVIGLTGGTIGGEIRASFGNDTLTWDGNGAVSGNVLMGQDADLATLRNLNEATLSITPSIDGGTGTTAGIGIPIDDALIFDRTSAANGARYANWESIDFTNGSVFTLDGRALVLGGSDTGTGAVGIDATSAVVIEGNAAISPFSAGLANVANAGAIDMSGAATTPTDRLSITGDYQGLNGSILFDSFLGADNSASDRLIVSEGTASGLTGIGVVNAGGPGAATTQSGILVVQAINGGSSTGDAFALERPVAAGAFEYLLFQGGMEAGTESNWYLRSSLIDMPTSPAVPPGMAIPLYRLEAATYAVVPNAAFTLGLQSLGTLDERRGSQQDAIDPEQPGWLRVFGQDIEQSWDGTVAPVFDGQVFGLQAGIDLLDIDAGKGQHTTAGLMLGTAGMSGKIRGFALGWDNYDVGHLDLRSTQFGAYVTHVGSSGWYLDGVVMASLLDGSATSSRGVGIDVKGVGVLASLEGGYPIDIGQGWTLEPQGQIIWQGMSLDSTADVFSDVRFGGTSMATGRIGLRLDKRMVRDNGYFEPAVFANLWQDFGGTRTTLGGNQLDTDNDGTALELGAGFTAAVGSNVSLFGNASYTMGLNSERRAGKAQLGLQVAF